MSVNMIAASLRSPFDNVGIEVLAESSHKSLWEIHGLALLVLVYAANTRANLRPQGSSDEGFGPNCVSLGEAVTWTRVL